jgi:hypothetical protein
MKIRMKAAAVRWHRVCSSSRFENGAKDAMASSENTRPKPTRTQRVVLGASAVVWALVVVAGLAMLWRYSVAPGAAGDAPTRWPASPSIARPLDRFTLVVVVHPHCACSRATIGELAELMARTYGRVTAYALFVRPDGFDDQWVETDLWQHAAAIPGVTPVRDDRGLEAHRFGALTSGQTMLYSPQGLLLFSGGITAARGHAGDNAGLSSVISMINAGTGERPRSSVFGCSLFGSESQA